ncbi:RAQPRD family integrative conjugative element protein [Variovorax sp. ZS18.2.2]|uniref:integrative conjugative element protein, RAQPRD family n=1 Tax=Variovorax sp. ZS18.2.2 TaxID=2971255 RepID=UPI00215143A9|nr:RAQPRD family integrative conjugative element protein [Variovorax sp. ZS18.2.2]MCR6480983.1 RAQPRD family integrative conjugative element protein [Variovorax sp. ZS18.2.2]
MACLGTAASAQAGLADDGDEEREQLARIDNELAQVQALVTRAEQSQPATPRVRFRYDWLQRDLQLLREGVRQHVDAPRQPRPVPPLRGDYRQ